MSMFRKVLLTVGLLIAANVVAFAQGTLKGTIMNASTKQPEPFSVEVRFIPVRTHIGLSCLAYNILKV